MDISSSTLPAPMISLLTGSTGPSVHQEVALRMLKQSIDLQGQLALSLLPQPPKTDPGSALGQTINVHA